VVVVAVVVTVLVLVIVVLVVVGDLLPFYECGDDAELRIHTYMIPVFPVSTLGPSLESPQQLRGLFCCGSVRPSLQVEVQRDGKALRSRATC
jgi:hypothetical protein